MKIKNYIPNTITCLNLISGCIAVWFAFNGDFKYALWAILVAAVFDFCDGLAARLLHAYSAVGKELDSLADVVSFGFAPGALVFSILEQGGYEWLRFGGFIIPAFSALRLAKFNLDERQTSSFLGLPVPANAIFWAGLAYAYSSFFAVQPVFLLVLTVIFSLLLVSELPMFSLKVKGLAWKDNKIQYLFLIGCAGLLIIFGLEGIMWLIVWYIAFSIILKYFIKK
jgi:CDP-diacylglycerol--serine O-phosphatidyltransferase